MKSLIIKVSRSNLGRLLYLANICLIATYYFLEMNVRTSDVPSSTQALCSGFIAGHYIQFGSPLLPFVALPNIFALYVSHFMVEALVAVLPGYSVITYSWVGAYLFIVVSSVQWLGLGYFIEKMIKRYRGEE